MGDIIIVKRKLLTAILSSLLFALIFSLMGGPEGDRFLNLYFNLYFLNLLIVGTYGVLASFFSDWISKKVTKRATVSEVISFLLHCSFGAVLLLFGLGSAIVFFVIDRLLRRVKIGWLPVIIALSVVVLVFVVLINL